MVTNGSLEEWLLESNGGQSPASAVGSGMGQWAHGMRSVASDGQAKLGALFTRLLSQSIPVCYLQALLMEALGAGLRMRPFLLPGKNVRNSRSSRPSILPEALRGSSVCLWCKWCSKYQEGLGSLVSCQALSQ